jgi:Zn-dependent protease/CBS domain-containing protein
VDETLRLGRIAGVRIGVNWTVLVIFGLILVGLSTVQLPVMFEGRAAAAYWIAGTLGAAAFFLSLLAHELAHAIVAQHHGVRVEGIVLWLFGGVAKLRDEAADPSADLRIAAVGPLVSLALGAFFGLVAWMMVTLGGTGIALGVLGWLALVNVVLALFNLVPAAPLDGGRILRALLWRRRGDRTEAAVIAARAGRFFGVVLITLGVAGVILLREPGGLWLALIGWFLTGAAGAEEQQARLHHSLDGLRVAQVMTREPVTVAPDVTVQSLLDDYVLRHRFSAFPVVDELGRPVGLVTLNRIRQLDRGARPSTQVGDIAGGVGEMAIVSPGEPVMVMLTRMGSSADRRAVVVDDGRVVGIVSPTDIARMLEIADVRSGVPTR